MEHLVRQRTDIRLELVYGNDDLVGRDCSSARVGGMALNSDHLGALEHLHPVIDQYILGPLHAQQWIDAVCTGITDARGEPLGSENTLEFVTDIDRLVRESDRFS